MLPGLARGGAETSLLRVARASGGAFEHLVVALKGGGALVDDFRSAGIDVVELDFAGPLAATQRMRALIATLAQFEPDLVLGQMYRGALAATIARRLGAPRSPMIWAFHALVGDPRARKRSTRLTRWLCVRLGGSVEAIVYPSPRAAAEHEALGFPAARTVVIPNGIDLEEFSFDGQARRRLRAEWGFSDDEIVVGHVARVHPVKQHPLMVDAFTRAVQRDRRLRLVLCGAGTDRLAIPDPLQGYVRRLGLRSDIAQVMSACDLGALSSSSESFGNVLAEFMACQRPCVSNDAGDPTAIVGSLGRVVPANDATALAEALLELAAIAPAEREALGRAARRSIAERFDIRRVAARHAELWRRAIGGAAPQE